VGGQHHAPAAFTPGKDLVPIVQEAGWAPGPVWTCAKNLAPTGIRSPDRPARSQSLPGPLSRKVRIKLRIYLQDEERLVGCCQLQEVSRRWLKLLKCDMTSFLCLILKTEFVHARVHVDIAKLVRLHSYRDVTQCLFMCDSRLPVHPGDSNPPNSSVMA
jgi:hypothetical protein